MDKQLPSAPPTRRTCIQFSIRDRVGALNSVLSVISNHQLDMTKIESRPSAIAQCYDFFVDVKVENSNGREILEKLSEELKALGIVNNVVILSSERAFEEKVPWYPRKISDLDELGKKTLECGEELNSDHPGFKDEEYRKRRKEIVSIASKYKHGETIPRVTYTPSELSTWGLVYRSLKALMPTHACKQYLHVFPLLEQQCGYSETNIPQIQDISDFLLGCTGWRLLPVSGLLSSRDFLNGLAFRVFHSTQYIRHHSKPFYTPEPDVCHELLGHVPLFADPSFADFSQEIGLASLGASDDDIVKLSTVYWFTVEFGLCKEGDSVKAYGAGILSSVEELQYALTDTPQKVPFDPFETAQRPYPITTVQPLYYVAESFESAKEKVKSYARSLTRKFDIYYNPFTMRIEVLDSKEKIARLADSIQSNVELLNHALRNSALV